MEDIAEHAELADKFLVAEDTLLAAEDTDMDEEKHADIADAAASSEEDKHTRQARLTAEARDAEEISTQFSARLSVACSISFDPQARKETGVTSQVSPTECSK